MAAELRTVSIVGIVDELGYIWCRRCVDVTDYDSGYIWSDSAPHRDESCDGCGEALIDEVS